MATKRSAPGNKGSVSDNSRSYSPGTKQIDSSIQMHKGPTAVADGGLNAISGDDPTTGTATTQAKAGLP